MHGNNDSKIKLKIFLNAFYVIAVFHRKPKLKKMYSHRVVNSLLQSFSK